MPPMFGYPTGAPGMPPNMPPAAMRPSPMMPPTFGGRY